MATVYKFQVSMPVTDTLPRNRISNTVHFQHAIGGQSAEQLETMCGDILEMYATRYGDATREILVKAYDTDAVPNYPRAEAVVNVGVPWNQSQPREVALCLSYAASHRGNKSERGRIYLNPAMSSPLQTMALRPTAGQLQWALDFYTAPNASFPDIGGVDWVFGVWSPTYKSFKQTEQAWVNDDWDVQRRRGLRETTRVQAQREG
jgi:hypothetical protein